MKHCGVKFFCDVSFLVIATYRVPNAPVDFLDDLDALLCKHVRPRTKVILARDFNLPHIN